MGALAYLDNGQYANAMEDAHVILARDPITKGAHSHAEAYNVVARGLVEAGRLADALDALDNALRIANEHGGYSAGRIATLQADRDLLATYLSSEDR